MMPISRPVGSRCPTCFHKYHTVLGSRNTVSRKPQESLLEWGLCDRRTPPHLQLSFPSGARVIAAGDLGGGDGKPQPHLESWDAAVERDHADSLAVWRRHGGIAVDRAGLDWEAAVFISA